MAREVFSNLLRAAVHSVRSQFVLNSYSSQFVLILVNSYSFFGQFVLISLSFDQFVLIWLAVHSTILIFARFNVQHEGSRVNYYTWSIYFPFNLINFAHHDLKNPNTTLILKMKLYTGFTMLKFLVRSHLRSGVP